MIFKEENLLKRAYEFFANPKAQFNKLTQPHRQHTAIEAAALPVVLAVGDTTYLDYKSIKAKREGYGPIGYGGSGLILHSTLAVEAQQGQSLVATSLLMRYGFSKKRVQRHMRRGGSAPPDQRVMLYGQVSFTIG